MRCKSVEKEPRRRARRLVLNPFHDGGVRNWCLSVENASAEPARATMFAIYESLAKAAETLEGTTP